MKVIIAIVLIVLLTIGLVWLIDRFVPKKLKPVIVIALWGLIFVLGYLTFNSVYGEIKFNQLKVERYKKVIKQLQDIRDSQIAFKQVNGKYADNFNSLVSFIDTAKVPITQRRDTTILDKEATRRYTIDMFKTEVVIDTLSYYSVKDSIFKGNERYKTMMNVAVGKEGSKFNLKATELEGIPVFEVSVDKSIVLDGQKDYLIEKEKQVVSVDDVNGPSLKVGSLIEINTNGNWPKNYAAKE